MASRSKRFRSGNESRRKPPVAPPRSENLDLDVESALRARFLTADLGAATRPQIVADAEYERIQGLAEDIVAGRLSVREARAQLRGAA